MLLLPQLLLPLLLLLLPHASQGQEVRGLQLLLLAHRCRRRQLLHGRLRHDLLVALL
jgi:hypothetical protein